VTASQGVGIGLAAGTDPDYMLQVSGSTHLVGNIGIGTIPSAYRLDVNGTTNLSGNTRIIGNVGIGVSPTTYKFDVTGTSRLNGAASIYGATTINSTLYVSNAATIAGNLIVPGGYVAISKSAADAMTMMSAGSDDYVMGIDYSDAGTFKINYGTTI